MIPDYFEALTAYRVFGAMDNGLLTGQMMREPWPPYHAFDSRCHHVQSGLSHILPSDPPQFAPAPVLDCGCGIHAFKTLQLAEQRKEESAHGPFGGLWMTDRTGVWGSISIWGHIIEHELGYRAQYAYPQELYTHEKRLAPLVSQLYGVPCTWIESARKAKEPWYDMGYSLIPQSIPAQRFWSAVSTYDPAKGVTDLTPMVEIKSRTIAAPPRIAGASRWQTREYGKVLTRDPIQLADWKDILKLMVYKNAPRV